MPLLVEEITVGARGSLLSRAQVQEVLLLLQQTSPHVDFIPTWFQTTGDRDLKTALSSMDRTDFFTKEVDEAVLKGICRVGIHSAKDLPDPLPEGLVVVAYTEGVDSSDALVMREGDRVETLAQGAKIGTSSLRREKNVHLLRSDFTCLEIRGSIDRRLQLLDAGEFDAIVVAKAALLRLKLERNVQVLTGEGCPMQGRLAVVAKQGDDEMKSLFASIHRQ